MKKFLTYVMILMLSMFTIGTTFASTNPFVNQLETTSSGSLQATNEIMATPIGGLIYFVIGMVVVMFFAGIILGILSFAKNKNNNN